jgi:hypothetical protein
MKEIESMPYVLIRHKVEDVATWKSVFDEHGPAREGHGSRGGQLFRNADEPDEVFVLLEVDELGTARRFAQSEDLRNTMRRAGVRDEPDIHFLEQVEVLAM